ncbi:Alpha-L-fucosidase [Penicillium cinerascens]|uniref:Alpha-L-fucosidase n=1 Tax=Penicillium cinerascens TaxID=70096 RepID=A0A9W9T715_9EURO|nr:Alpha-L-fucosidase [Penicillium cinerascens]KAJ5211671.1 Alpha-L-fucosidase [Penicillium cinerascens]
MDLDKITVVEETAMEELWYEQPANDWNEALPVGNGRLGAMVYGRTDTEMLPLNEDSVWYGAPQDRNPRDAFNYLPKLRQAIRDRDHKEAERLATLSFFANPISQRQYEPLGTLFMDFGHGADHITGYRRWLNIDDATANVKYKYHGHRCKRTVLASYPDNVIAIRVSSELRTEFIVRLSRMSELEFETNEYLDDVYAGDDYIRMHVTPGGRDSNRACCIVAVHCLDHLGSVKNIGNNLVVNSKDTFILVAAQTTFRHADIDQRTSQDIHHALNCVQHSVSELYKRHTADYQSLFRRMDLQMIPTQPEIPTDKRIQDSRDPGLIALYHNYSRYLLISCSRNGDKALPANLQGIWNPSFHPAWGSKFTININLQMNYWPANICNLSECELPLFDLLQRMAESGRTTAQRMYGCRGWAAHSCTDIWADTAPVDRWMPATIWPLGGAWLCYHIWEHFQFTGEHDFLRRMFPILRGCVEFLIDFLVEDATMEYLTTSPSVSPENSFYDKGQKGVLCEGSTIDIQIVRAILDAFESSVNELGVMDALLPSVRTIRDRLAPMKISDSGYLQEWAMDYDEVEPGHRHTSHLWALYPGNAITPTTTPDLAEACGVVLRRRAEHGGGHTGWSRAWLINLHARLLEAEDCSKHLDLLLAHSTLPNMLDSHPPFQIDGNFGGGAGIVEMLVQSHEPGLIRLLPACPKGWTGSIRGVKARGGFELEFSWENGCIVGQVMVMSRGKETTICFPGEDGRRVRIKNAGGYLGIHVINA